MKKIILFLLLGLVSGACDGQAHNWAWAKVAGGADDDEGYSVAADAVGNVYVAGYFISPAITFGTTTLTNVGAAGTGDLFLVKYAPDGTVIWAKSEGGTGFDEAYSVATDNFGNVLVAGNFNSPSITIGTFTLTGSGSLLIKYDTSGAVIWAKTNQSFGISSMAIDRFGNAYVAGLFSTDTIIVANDTLINADFPNPHQDVVLVKYNASGTILWARGAGGYGNDFLDAVATDINGNVFLTGAFSSFITFGTATFYYSGSSYSPYLAKYDSSGTVLWASNPIGNDADAPSCVATDTAGNSYLTGRFCSMSIIFGTDTLINSSIVNYSDLFLVKYAPNGTVLWAKSAGTSGNYNDSGSSVALDAEGNIYVSGNNSSVPIIFGSDIITHRSTFIVKYAPAGTALWARSGIYSYLNGINSIAVTAVDNIYATGFFTGSTIDFGQDTLTNSNSSTYDMFFTKIDTNAIVNHTGISEINNFHSITLFPNPATRELRITNEELKIENIHIYNILGECVQSSVIGASSSSATGITIDVSGIAKGIYFVEIKTGKGVENKKVIIQ